MSLLVYILLWTNIGNPKQVRSTRARNYISTTTQYGRVAGFIFIAEKSRGTDSLF